MGGRFASRLVLFVGAVVAIVFAGGEGDVGASSSALAWVDRSVHVVGGPVSAPGQVLVVVSSANRSAWLEAIDAKTGAVNWRLPAGFSDITAGVTTTPLVRDGVALALVPAGGKGSSLVRLEGIDVSSGKVLWSRRPTFVEDAPSSCPPPIARRGFCTVVGRGSLSSDLIALAPRTGAELARVPNILRAMGLTFTRPAPTLR